MTLFRQFFMANLKGLLIWMAVGLLMGFSGTRSAATFLQSNTMEMMPPQLLAMYGNLAGLKSVDLYLTILIGKGTVLIPTLYAMIVSLQVVTREVDKRTVEFLLALPVQRASVLAARIAAMAVNITLVTGSIWATIRFDMPAQGFEGNWGHFDVLMFNLWLLSMALGALTLAASVWIDDYSVAVKLFLGIATVAFFIEFALRGAQVSRAGRFWSPFSYVDISEVMRSGSIAAGNAVVLVLTILAGFVISFWAFDRKQFSA